MDAVLHRLRLGDRYEEQAGPTVWWDDQRHRITGCIRVVWIFLMAGDLTPEGCETVVVGTVDGDVPDIRSHASPWPLSVGPPRYRSTRWGGHREISFVSLPTDVRPPSETPLMVTSGAAHGASATARADQGVRPDIVDQRVREMPCGLVPQRWGCLLAPSGSASRPGHAAGRP
jgi:hypothetical protein